MKRKKVKRPQYEQWAGNDYTNYLKEDLPTYRDQYNYMLGQLDVTSPEVQQAFQDKANEYTQAQWSDFNRNALANYKAMNQANRNRFGNLGSSGAMYGADSYNRQLNDLASRIAGQTAGQYENLMNNYYNQKYNTAQMYGNAYTYAGDFLTKQLDQPNWRVRLQNQENRYLDQVDNANRGGWNWGNAAVGGLTGLATGGVLGGVTGFVGGGLADSGQSAAQLGGTIGQGYGRIGQSLLGSSTAPNWLSNKTGNTILFGGYGR